MQQFDQVTVRKKANFYFDGKVTSRTVLFPDGERKTLGIMLPGEYTFGTDAQEHMEILAGEMDVLLPDATAWIHVCEGESFVVPEKASFDLKVLVPVDYCCSYIEK